MEIELDLNENLDKNASDYFQKSKNLKKKLEGAKKALVEAKMKLETQVKKEEDIENKKVQAKKERERKKEWYEKFRWFKSSDGFLVIGGRDAGSNEIVIKKHMDENDLVYHTQSPGSPFVVIKNPDSVEIPKITKQEAATFAATFSKVWNSNQITAEVMEVKPNQVSKEANSGEYIEKGSFMIRGKREIYHQKLNLAIGLLKKNFDGKDIKDKVVMSGPDGAVQKNCENIIKLKQGNTKKGDIVKTIMKEFKMRTNEDILSALPSGKYSLRKK